MDSNELINLLATEYGLEVQTGKDELRDLYKKHSKWLITKAGITKMRNVEAARGRVVMHQEEPLITSLTDRVCISGWWRLEEPQGGAKKPKVISRIWTTGEGKYTAKAVEGSHSVAVAEKRWVSRGTLDLLVPLVAPGLQVYTPDQFDSEFFHGKKDQQPPDSPAMPPVVAPAPSAAPVAPPAPPTPAPAPAPPVPEPAPPVAAQHPVGGGSGEWGIVMSRIAQMCGFPYTQDFDQKMLRACGWFKDAEGKATRVNIKYKPDFQTFQKEAGGWAEKTLVRAKQVLAELERGVSQTVHYDEYRGGAVQWDPLILTAPPSGSAPEFPDASDFGQGGGLPDDVPF